MTKRKLKPKPLYDYPEYREKLKIFKSITDYPVALTLSTDQSLSLSERLQVMHYDNAVNLQDGAKAVIIVVCFNEVIRVRRIDSSDI